MDGKFYGTERFDPRLIITQIIVMQSAWYMCLAVLTMCVDWFVGAQQSLSQLFLVKAYTWDTNAGFALACSMWCTALVMALVLRVVVERAKKCLDFVATYHIFHLVFTWCISGFPNVRHWWIINSVAGLVAVLLGEYACMKAEQKAIKLGSKSSKREKMVV
eukprot:gnl/TRDRNA2_/TRDRNA2_151801_c1_seq1.p1 gnl/TRDRNA2_/TRDRNA2_151801_c1~~gnl/TRDRNA2_/TRDRNA2_151801_c1_seq1.p1  ORF type:complete len:161 (-),score=29.02 gnl/TRDRNA2_/TRDRNA2_151801_c1_seq1:92-574(-)